MKFLKIAGLSLLCAFGTGTAANASLIITITQQSNDVVSTASGSVDTADLTYSSAGSFSAGVQPSAALIALGNATGSSSRYSGLSGPMSFGMAGSTSASSTSGSYIALEGNSGSILLPTAYVSGTLLSSTDTWSNATLASLGLTQASYVYTWGTGQDADSLTVNIGNAAVSVPEPASLMLVCGGLLSLAGFAAMRRRKTSETV